MKINYKQCGAVYTRTFLYICKYHMQLNSFGFLIKMWTRKNKCSLLIFLSLSSPQSRICVLTIALQVYLGTSTSEVPNSWHHVVVFFLVISVITFYFLYDDILRISNILLLNWIVFFITLPRSLFTPLLKPVKTPSRVEYRSIRKVHKNDQHNRFKQVATLI